MSAQFLELLTIAVAAATAAGTAWGVWSTRQNAANGKYPIAPKIVLDALEIFKKWLRSTERLAKQRRAPHSPRGLLIDLFMPPDRAEDVIYNLLGRYDHWVEAHGPRWARIIFYLQSVGSIVTFWTDWMLKRVKLLKMFVSN